MQNELFLLISEFNSYFRGGMKIEKFFKCEPELKICFPQKLTCFMNFQKPFYFLVCVICILTYFSYYTGTYPFLFNFFHTFSKVKLSPLPPPPAPAVEDSARHLTCNWRRDHLAFKPRFHYTANATTTTQKQSD